jgi:nitroreductase
MEAIELLLTRASNGKLTEPAPDEETLRLSFAAAVRAPDHGDLKPFRFILVRGPARERLGGVFEAALRRRDPKATEEVLAKERNKPLRAPLIIVVAAKLVAHPKIPKIAQLLAAAASAHAILLALHARGFAGMWRTGEPAYDDEVKVALGLEPGDAIAGFVYAGSPSVVVPERKRANPSDIVREW